MNDSEILAGVKKAIDNYLDKTYEISDLYSHMLTIVKENSLPALEHKKQLERLIFKVDELRENQRLYWNGHKSKLGVCKGQETELDKKIAYLLSHGYSISEYKNKAIQKSLL